MWSSPRLQGRSSKLDTNRLTLKSVFKQEVRGNSILADAFRGPQPLRHSGGPPHVPEAPCDASSVRAADELAPSWLLSESAIFSCRRASAAPRLPRPEPRRLRGQTEMVSEGSDITSAIKPVCFTHKHEESSDVIATGTWCWHRSPWSSGVCSAESWGALLEETRCAS